MRTQFSSVKEVAFKLLCDGNTIEFILEIASMADQEQRLLREICAMAPV